MTTTYFAANKKKQIDSYAQRLILEVAIVNRIQNQVAHANVFDLRSFKLYLKM